jgi:N6-L-threonylcarbamoyladenine synthase
VPTILALETSCDETAAAVLREGVLLASEVASQMEIHREYGGVVPEVASRNHLRTIRPVLETALARAGVSLTEVDAFAATAGPGLATSLMIGLSAAKGLAIGSGKPFFAVNHLEGHLLSPFFGRTVRIEPSIALVVSGGHTLLVEIRGFRDYRLLGQTRDDAAGEAFDKVGKLLGLPYPAGPVIDRLARTGDAARFDFPRSMLSSGDFAFSFSGLKTSVRYMLPKLAGASGRVEEALLPDVCASFQEAIVDVLVGKTLEAARVTGHKVVAISGGVSCNARLRVRFREACAKARLELLLAEPALCTDNAGMIAHVAAHLLAAGIESPVTAEIHPNLALVSG